MTEFLALRSFDTSHRIGRTYIYGRALLLGLEKCEDELIDANNEQEPNRFVKYQILGTVGDKRNIMKLCCRCTCFLSSDAAQLCSFREKKWLGQI